MANYREEHIRNNRRLARQVVGAAALLLALIGLFTVLGWIVGLVRAALDDTDLRNEYRDRLKRSPPVRHGHAGPRRF